MAKARVLTTDEQIDAALEAGRQGPPVPMARRVEYLPGPRLLLVYLKSGQRLAIPVEEVEELANASDEQLAHIELLEPGTGIRFPEFDGGLYVPYLVAGSRGSRKWMEQLEASRNAVAVEAA